MAKTQTSPETSLKLQRTFPAPRERVFRAWSDPKELAMWFAPSPDHKPVLAEMDPEFLKGQTNAATRPAATSAQLPAK